MDKRKIRDGKISVIHESTNKRRFPLSPAKSFYSLEIMGNALRILEVYQMTL